jgi:hypothetical protein
MARASVSSAFQRFEGAAASRAGPSNDRASISACVYLAERPASFTIRDGFVPGSFPHAARQRNPSGWMRS